MGKVEESGETRRWERRREGTEGRGGMGTRKERERNIKVRKNGTFIFPPALCISALSFPKQLGVLLTVFEVQHCPAAADEYN